MQATTLQRLNRSDPNFNNAGLQHYKPNFKQVLSRINHSFRNPNDQSINGIYHKTIPTSLAFGPTNAISNQCISADLLTELPDNAPAGVGTHASGMIFQQIQGSKAQGGVIRGIHKPGDATKAWYILDYTTKAYPALSAEDFTHTQVIAQHVDFSVSQRNLESLSGCLSYGHAQKAQDIYAVDPVDYQHVQKEYSQHITFERFTNVSCMSTSVATPFVRKNISNYSGMGNLLSYYTYEVPEEIATMKLIEDVQEDPVQCTKIEKRYKVQGDHFLPSQLATSRGQTSPPLSGLFFAINKSPKEPAYDEQFANLVQPGTRIRIRINGFRNYLTDDVAIPDARVMTVRFYFKHVTTSGDEFDYLEYQDYKFFIQDGTNIHADIDKRFNAEVHMITIHTNEPTTGLTDAYSMSVELDLFQLIDASAYNIQYTTLAQFSDDVVFNAGLYQQTSSLMNVETQQTYSSNRLVMLNEQQTRLIQAQAFVLGAANMSVAIDMELQNYLDCIFMIETDQNAKVIGQNLSAGSVLTVIELGKELAPYIWSGIHYLRNTMPRAQKALEDLEKQYPEAKLLSDSLSGVSKVVNFVGDTFGVNATSRDYAGEFEKLKSNQRHVGYNLSICDGDQLKQFEIRAPSTSHQVPEQPNMSTPVVGYNMEFEKVEGNQYERMNIVEGDEDVLSNVDSFEQDQQILHSRSKYITWLNDQKQQQLYTSGSHLAYLAQTNVATLQTMCSSFVTGYCDETATNGGQMLTMIMFKQPNWLEAEDLDNMITLDIPKDYNQRAKRKLTSCKVRIYGRGGDFSPVAYPNRTFPADQIGELMTRDSEAGLVLSSILSYTNTLLSQSDGVEELFIIMKAVHHQGNSQIPTQFKGASFTSALLMHPHTHDLSPCKEVQVRDGALKLVLHQKAYFIGAVGSNEILAINESSPKIVKQKLDNLFAATGHESYETVMVGANSAKLVVRHQIKQSLPSIFISTTSPHKSRVGFNELIKQHNAHVKTDFDFTVKTRPTGFIFEDQIITFCEAPYFQYKRLYTQPTQNVVGGTQANWFRYLKESAARKIEPEQLAAGGKIERSILNEIPDEFAQQQTSQTASTSQVFLSMKRTFEPKLLDRSAEHIQQKLKDIQQYVDEQFRAIQVFKPDIQSYPQSLEIALTNADRDINSTLPSSLKQFFNLNDNMFPSDTSASFMKEGGVIIKKKGQKTQHQYTPDVWITDKILQQLENSTKSVKGVVTNAKLEILDAEFRKAFLQTPVSEEDFSVQMTLPAFEGNTIDFERKVLTNLSGPAFTQMLNLMTKQDGEFKKAMDAEQPNDGTFQNIVEFAAMYNGLDIVVPNRLSTIAGFMADLFGKMKLGIYSNQSKIRSKWLPLRGPLEEIFKEINIAGQKGITGLLLPMNKVTLQKS